eukprot:CAMPEP_0119311722 /NCGR_PEP_ID=MMETSP1333-20130426/23637_1 /TAXON_ID=418940 /ORGANISM="Scyphosphaera apsteinii, Strain RCC1455" /LENGTH=333 /DNA_ID=CAMNT_0007316185 /DNA_START=71 /DNA_END=1069 /DNA_ORIENTATION=-
MQLRERRGSEAGSTGSTRRMAADATPIIVQGGALRTWSYSNPHVEQVQIVLRTEGRPLDADIELWHGPGNTPCKMRVFVEDGRSSPFSAVIETPRSPNTVAIRNIGPTVFPLSAKVFADNVDVPSQECIYSSMIIQGGALRTYPVDSYVNTYHVLLQTDGRPLNARIELLQGPNNNKQAIELYAEDGLDRPFFCVLETPGSGGVVRVINTAPVEFPMTASVVPHSINPEMAGYPSGGRAYREAYSPGASSAAPPYLAEAQAVERFATEQAEAAKATAMAATEAARMAQREARHAAKVRQEEAGQRQRQQAVAVDTERANTSRQSANAADKPWW